MLAIIFKKKKIFAPGTQSMWYFAALALFPFLPPSTSTSRSRTSFVVLPAAGFSAAVAFSTLGKLEMWLLPFEDLLEMDPDQGLN